MGDRAQLQITNGERSIFLYTHWGGVELARATARGLSTDRTLDSDPAYAMGNVLRSIVRDAGGLDSTSGLGVGFAFEDNDDERGAPLVLDIVKRTVSFKSKSVPVKAFIAAPEKSVGWA